MRALVILASLIFNLLFLNLSIADEFTALESRIDSQLYELVNDKWDSNKTKMIKELVETKLVIENLRIARINIMTAEPKVAPIYKAMKTTEAEKEKEDLERRRLAEARAEQWKTRTYTPGSSMPGSREAAKDFVGR